MSDDPVLAALIRLEAAQATLQAGQVTLQAGQATLRADVMERIDRLQDSVRAGLDSIHDDIAVTMHHSHRTREAHDATRVELRSLNETVDLLQRKLARVEAEVREIKDMP